jgi:hypothetical protein
MHQPKNLNLEGEKNSKATSRLSIWPGLVYYRSLSPYMVAVQIPNRPKTKRTLPKNGTTYKLDAEEDIRIR